VIFAARGTSARRATLDACALSSLHQKAPSLPALSQALPDGSLPPLYETKKDLQAR
jgi:hypothetical protein